MSETRTLVLPDTYEALVKELGSDYERMARFVVPVLEAERQLAIIARSIRRSGRVVLLLGLPGSGKSTFIQSLKWRTHLPISDITEIDAFPFFTHEQSLGPLFGEIQHQANESVKRKRANTVPTLVLNYLENLEGIPSSDIRAFFRNINGLLRRVPVLIVWPVTQQSDAHTLLEQSSAVSGTVFSDEPILMFDGPPISDFPVIAKNTITVLNPGLSFDDFLLNDDELAQLREQLKLEPPQSRTIRDYLRRVKEVWHEKSGELQRIAESIPKPTEVWFVICYPDAESDVSAFARKSPYAPDDAWDADYRQLSQYIVGAGRAADWDPKRLQFALRGAFRTKIMFLPTNAIVSCIAAYGADHGVPRDVLDAITETIHPNWGKKVIARRFLKSSPLMRQLTGEPPKLGKRRSGSSARSIRGAGPAFIEINQYAQRSDQPLNHCLAQALRDNLAAGESQVAAEVMHPYLENIIPDIQVRTDPGRIVCIEMFYTVSRVPSNLADYVLRKMDRYMKQLEFFTTKQPALFFMDS